MLLLVFALIPFVFYLVNPVLIGADNYYFFTSITCNHFDLAYTPKLSLIIFELLPCNLIAFKLFGFILMFLVSVIIAKAGEKLYALNGWLCGAFIYLAPGFIPFFAMIEDDNLSYLFFCLSIYYFIQKKYVKALLVFIPIVFLWKGYPLLAAVFASNLFIFLIVPTLIYFVLNYYYAFGFFNSVYEQLPLIGVTQILFLMLGLFSIPKIILGGTIILLVMGLINAKFMIWVVPFLALSMLGTLNRFKFMAKREFHVLEIGLGLTIPIILASSILLTGLIPTVYPNQEQIKAVQYAVSLDSNINNDWSYGYWIEFYGVSASSKGGAKEFIQQPNINLTEENLNCLLLQEFGFGFRDKVKVYEC